MTTRSTMAFTDGLALALVAHISACTLLVEPEAEAVRCEVQSGRNDPCAELGLACIGGVCSDCQAEEELCDGVDNDCDGRVDEGHDEDGDGFTWCGGGRMELMDCDPQDPRIHPPTEMDLDGSGVVEERCDDRDNDCDGEVDEGIRCGLFEF